MQQGRRQFCSAKEKNTSQFESFNSSSNLIEYEGGQPDQTDDSNKLIDQSQQDIQAQKNVNKLVVMAQTPKNVIKIMKKVSIISEEDYQKLQQNKALQNKSKKMSKFGNNLRVDTKSVINILNVSKTNITKRSSQIIESKVSKKISETFDLTNQQQAQPKQIQVTEVRSENDVNNENYQTKELVETDSSNTIAPDENEILADEDGCCDDSSISDFINETDEIQGQDIVAGSPSKIRGREEDEAEEEQVTEKFSEKKEIEVEKKPREEMNGIVVYDSYAKLTGNTKIVQYHENKVLQKIDPYILFDKTEVKDANRQFFSDKIKDRDFNTGEEKIIFKNLPASFKMQRDFSQPAFEIFIPQMQNVLVFDSRFENGNLRKVAKVNNISYNLWLENDLNTKGHTQWYFFKVIYKDIENRKDRKEHRIKFNILNLAKTSSLYQKGMQPCIWSKRKFEKDGTGWFRGGEDISYRQNDIPRKINGKVGGEGSVDPTSLMTNNNSYLCNHNAAGEGIDFYFTLSFTYPFVSNQDDEVWFAHAVPYDYTQMQTKLRELRDNIIYKDFLKFNILSRTNAKIPVPIMTITERSDTYLDYYEELNLQTILPQILKRSFRLKYLNVKKLMKQAEQSKGKVQRLLYNAVEEDLKQYFIDNEEQFIKASLSFRGFGQRMIQYVKDHCQKRAIIITSRVHPGEPQASYMLDGIINYLLSPQAEELRKNFVFKIIPMLNPDGVIYGNYRCSLLGCDLNRRWDQPNKILHPTIYYAKNIVRLMNQDRKIVLFCDLHGHSRKMNAFFFGNSYKNFEADGRIKNAQLRIIPLLCCQKNQIFQSKSCKYQIEKNKESTARVVVFKEFMIQNSFTLECSFYGKDNEFYKKHNQMIKQLESNPLQQALYLANMKPEEIILSKKKQIHMDTDDYINLGDTLMSIMNNYLPCEEEKLSIIQGKVLDLFYDEFMKLVPSYILKQEEEQKKEEETKIKAKFINHSLRQQSNVTANYIIDQQNKQNESFQKNLNLINNQLKKKNFPQTKLTARDLNQLNQSNQEKLDQNFKKRAESVFDSNLLQTNKGDSYEVQDVIERGNESTIYQLSPTKFIEDELALNVIIQDESSDNRNTGQLSEDEENDFIKKPDPVKIQELEEFDQFLSVIGKKLKRQQQSNQETGDIKNKQKIRIEEGKKSIIELSDDDFTASDNESSSSDEDENQKNRFVIKKKKKLQIKQNNDKLITKKITKQLEIPQNNITKRNNDFNYLQISGKKQTLNSKQTQQSEQQIVKTTRIPIEKRMSSQVKDLIQSNERQKTIEKKDHRLISPTKQSEVLLAPILSNKKTGRKALEIPIVEVKAPSDQLRNIITSPNQKADGQSPFIKVSSYQNSKRQSDINQQDEKAEEEQQADLSDRQLKATAQAILQSPEIQRLIEEQLKSGILNQEEILQEISQAIIRNKNDISRQIPMSPRNQRIQNQTKESDQKINNASRNHQRQKTELSFPYYQNTQIIQHQPVQLIINYAQPNNPNNNKNKPIEVQQFNPNFDQRSNKHTPQMKAYYNQQQRQGGSQVPNFNQNNKQPQFFKQNTQTNVHPMMNLIRNSTNENEQKSLSPNIGSPPIISDELNQKLQIKNKHQSQNLPNQFLQYPMAQAKIDKMNLLGSVLTTPQIPHYFGTPETGKSSGNQLSNNKKFQRLYDSNKKKEGELPQIFGENLKFQNIQSFNRGQIKLDVNNNQDLLNLQQQKFAKSLVLSNKNQKQEQVHNSHSGTKDRSVNIEGSIYQGISKTQNSQISIINFNEGKADHSSHNSIYPPINQQQKNSQFYVMTQKYQKNPKIIIKEGQIQEPLKNLSRQMNQENQHYNNKSQKASDSPLEKMQNHQQFQAFKRLNFEMKSCENSQNGSSDRSFMSSPKFQGSPISVNQSIDLKFSKSLKKEKIIKTQMDSPNLPQLRISPNGKQKSFKLDKSFKNLDHNQSSEVLNLSSFQASQKSSVQQKQQNDGGSVIKYQSAVKERLKNFKLPSFNMNDPHDNLIIDYGDPLNIQIQKTEQKPLKSHLYTPINKVQVPKFENTEKKIENFNPANHEHYFVPPKQRVLQAQIIKQQELLKNLQAQLEN